MNPNLNKCPKTNARIPLNDTHEKHCCHMWKNYVEPAGFGKVLVVAHSYGGHSMEAIQTQFARSFYKMNIRVALTDSHEIPKRNLLNS